MERTHPLQNPVALDTSAKLGITQMNKAFVKESENDDEDLDIVAVQIPQASKNYITPGGFARMKAEHEFLIKIERPRVVETVAWAASNGDRSENGDYIYGKKRLREIDRRIRFLNKRLDIAEIVDPTHQSNRTQVFFGATVTVADLDNEGSETTYCIVGVDETDLSRGYISWICPLARALMKARQGDVVFFQAPGGTREIEVISITYKPILIEPHSPS